MNSRLLPVLAVAFLALPSSAHAQLSFGAHVARANDVFDGANGVGVSAALDVPLFPVGVLVAGDYFLPDCGAVEGCGYMGGSASAVFRLPMPLVRPYATAGLVWRRFTAADGFESVSNQGYGLGAGIDLNTLLLRLYLEARYEFVDPDDQMVMRLGVLF